MILFPGLIGSISKVFASLSSGWNQQSILSGSLAVDSDDFFGQSVAMNSIGDRIVVGAQGDEKIGGSGSSGLAYVFVSGTGGWTEQPILSGSLAVNSFDEFGYRVAMNSTGNRIVVGAHRDERIGGSVSSGLAYVFISGTGGWSQQHILSGSLAVGSSDNFGFYVAMNSIGDRIVVGAPNDERTGTNNEGLAYVFVSGTGGWSQQHILSGTLATDTDDDFGFRVAINSIGDRIVVGAQGDEKIGGSGSSGLAYVFVSGTGGWSQQHILSGSLAVDSSDEFGSSIAMNSIGDRIVVGAQGDEKIGGSDSSGLAYVFISGTGGWTEQHILSGSLAVDSFDYFGWSVAMNSIGDRIIVGARQDGKIGTSFEGLAYVFVSGTGGWTQQHILSGTLATDDGDDFGSSIAMNSIGDRIVVGADGDDRSGGIGSSGLAYVFHDIFSSPLPPPPLSYSITSGQTSIDNSSGIYGNPPGTITNTLTLTATGTGTETVTINLNDFSSGAIQCSFNQFTQVNTTSIIGGSSVSFYFTATDNGLVFTPVSADLTISGSGGNNIQTSLIYYPNGGI